MDIGNSEQLLDEALTALLDMRGEEIDRAAGKLELLAADAGNLSLTKLNHLRAAALHAAQLWRVCLPEADSNYSPDGLPAGSISPAGISISG